MQIKQSLRLSRWLSYFFVTSGILFLLSFFALPQFLPSDSHATPGVEPNISLAISGSNSLSLSVTPGQFNSASQSITVETTNYTGYTMTIAPSPGNTTELVNTNDSNLTIPSISSNLSSSAFSSLTTTAYGLSIDNGANYMAVTNGAVINSTNAPTNSTTGTFTLTLGAKVQGNTQAGTYEKTFTLSAVVNPTPYSITYDKNTTDTVSNMPTSADTTLSGLNVTLSTMTPTRSGYQFLGWDEDPNATTPTYTVGDTIALDPERDLNDNTYVLYAIWDAVHVISFVNTATSATITQTISAGQSINVATSPAWTRTGYRLIGWDTVTNDGSGSTGTVVYTDGQAITPTTDMTFYTVWRPIYTIVYDINTTDANAAGSMSMVSHTNVVEGNQINLYASNFSRTNYGFAGWSLDSTATVNGSSTIYGPNATITAPAYNNNNTITLYAVWVPVATDSNGNALTFQTSNLLNITLSDNTTLASKSNGYVAALKDTRDNQVYAVAKLADGNYWMIENLRLDPAGKTLDSTNTNSPTASFSTTAAALSSSTFATCTSENDSTCIDQYSLGLGNLNRNNTASPSTNNQNTQWYSYGGMYNWYTATAGNGTYSMSGGTVTGDICPAGWRLPSGTLTGGSSGEFYTLNTVANSGSTSTSTGLRTYPNNFLYSGYYQGSNTFTRGSGGNYWSSTAGYNHVAYSLMVGNGVYPGTDFRYRYEGMAIRCLAKQISSYTLTISTGTGVDSVIIDNTTYHNGDTVSLAENTTHTINMTFTTGYEFDSWAVSGATVVSTSAQSTTLTMGSTNATLTASAKTATAYMQDWNGCNSLSANQTITLVDKRDDKAYTVSKLGTKCWMTQNLRLDFSSLANKDINELEAATNNPASGFFTSARGAAASNSGFNAGHYEVVKYNKTNIGGTSCANTNTACDAYGIYYNWYTATAGHGTQSKTLSDGPMPGDICPSGWHLPTGTNTGDFYALNTAINSGSSTNSSNLRASPANFVYSGYYSESGSHSRGSNGNYWSSTARNGSGAYYFSFSNSTVYPGTSSYSKYYGQTIRCIAKDSAANQSNSSPENGNSTPDNTEPQNTPQYTPTYSPSSVPTNNPQPTNAKSSNSNDKVVKTKDDTKDASSEKGNISPLGVETAAEATDIVLVESGSTIPEGDSFYIIMAAAGATAITAGAILLAKKKDDDEEEQQS